MKAQYRVGALLVAIALGGYGCSTVRIIKVEENQPHPEGMPFYMPRAYVQVFEPFVLGSTAYLVSGVISSDGKYLLVDNVKDRDDLGGIYRPGGQKKYSIPVTDIRRTSRQPMTGAPQGDEVGTTPATGSTPATSNTPPASPGDQPANSTPSPEQQPASTPTGGKTNISVTNTSSYFMPIFGRRYFDIIWLPDTSEKYVVQGRGRLGNADIKITMTQGWGLWGIDAKLDNTAVVKPILDGYTTVLGSLTKLATSKIQALTGGAPQGAFTESEIPPGTRVTIKITKVQVAAPGLYRILKDNEVAMVQDPSNGPGDHVKLHYPQRPYTNVAFNMYEVIVIEAAKVEGDSPMNLQRYYEPASATPTSPMYQPAVSRSNLNVDDLTSRVNSALQSQAGPNGEFWSVSGLAIVGEKLKGSAKLNGGIQKPPSLDTMEKLQQFVAGHTSNQFRGANVVLTED